jgi:hypothetical protein
MNKKIQRRVLWARIYLGGLSLGKAEGLLTDALIQESVKRSGVPEGGFMGLRKMIYRKQKSTHLKQKSRYPIFRFHRPFTDCFRNS